MTLGVEARAGLADGLQTLGNQWHAFCWLKVIFDTPVSLHLLGYQQRAPGPLHLLLTLQQLGTVHASGHSETVATPVSCIALIEHSALQATRRRNEEVEDCNHW